jgi:hypothetical protein
MRVPNHCQASLPGHGPDAGDSFRFTWWNTATGAEVWIEARGGWCRGIVSGRRRRYVEVEIPTARGRRRRVKRLYSELRRRE